MIKPIRYEKLGHANHGWLDARHHFSFANYYDPLRMGFGKLRVINDDLIAAKKGFGKHAHRDMEIITFVREGAISHRDDKGNTGKTQSGDVQVMSAGTGIYHSEYNDEETTTNIYQLWIEPKKLSVKPAWDSHAFPKSETRDALALLVSGDGKAPLFINQDAWIYGGNLRKNTRLTHHIKQQAYLLVSKGQISVNDILFNKGDGAEITNEEIINLHANSDCEILLIDVPA